jgi:hypothetical protein
MSAYCPKCGSHFSNYEIVEITNPGPDVYDSCTVQGGKTYRQLGISGKGKWMVYLCYSHLHNDKTIAWAKLEKRY